MFCAFLFFLFLKTLSFLFLVKGVNQTSSHTLLPFSFLFLKSYHIRQNKEKDELQNLPQLLTFETHFFFSLSFHFNLIIPIYKALEFGFFS